MVVVGALTAKVLTLDVLLPIVDKVFDILTIYGFFSNGDVWWGTATIGVILLPGILELLYWSVSKCKDVVSTKVWCGWSIFFGPILYPFSTIVW